MTAGGFVSQFVDTLAPVFAFHLAVTGSVSPFVDKLAVTVHVVMDSACPLVDTAVHSTDSASLAMVCASQLVDILDFHLVHMLEKVFPVELVEYALKFVVSLPPAHLHS